MDIVLQATQSIACGSLNKSSHFHHRTGNDILFALDYIDFFRMWVVFRQCSDQTLIYPCPKHCFWPKSSLHCRGYVAVGSWSRINWFCHIPYNPEAAHLTEKKKFLWKFVTCQQKAGAFRTGVASSRERHPNDAVSPTGLTEPWVKLKME